MVTILHQSLGPKDGRVRFLINNVLRSHHLAEWLTQGFLKQNGVIGVTCNPRTGSLLIHYKKNEITVDGLKEIVFELLAKDPRSIRRHYFQKKCKMVRKKDQLIPPNPWYVLDADQALELCKSSLLLGLSTKHALLNLETYGQNLFARKLKRSESEIFLSQFKNLPVALLFASSGLSILTGGFLDAAVIIVVVLINAYLGYVMESSAEKTVDLLNRVKFPDVLVIRDGKPCSIKIENVALGDILLLTPGTQVPADARLLRVDNLQVDESILTGESLPIDKNPHHLSASNIPIGDRTNMVFRGTMVTSGSATALVVATGGSTELGLIEELMGKSVQPDTPLERELERVSKQMVVASVAVSGFVLGLGLFRKASLLESLKTAISLAVAAIPEGLPTVATVVLAQSVTRLKKHHLLIRHMDAVETLGNIDVVCFDKTGTLTLNEMNVTRIQTSEGIYLKEDHRISHNGVLIETENEPTLYQLIKIAALCNESEFINDKVTGSATEAALLRLALNENIAIKDLRDRYPCISTQYRSENRSYMMTVHAESKKKGHAKVLVAAKGRPDQLIEQCSHYLKDGRVVELKERDRLDIELANTDMARSALRVLGVAYRELNDEDDAQTAKLIWLGLVGLKDPIRPGVKKFISKLHNAGIRSVMVTGDQNETALAIGKELDLGFGEKLKMIDSLSLKDMPKKELSSRLADINIVSRVSPSDKLYIVQALQQAGKIVAMTGDGINDGPALKVADIGIAMGGKDANSIHTAADLVIAKNNLKALIHGIEEGRTIHHDLKKAVNYILSQNMSEVLFTFLSVCGGMGEPLTPMQLLWVNLITDIMPELALCQEPPESDVLDKPPSIKNNSLISKDDLKRIGFQSLMLTAASLAGYIYGFRKYGPGDRAKTIGFIVLNTSSLLHTFSSRSERTSIFDSVRLPKNPYVPASVGLGFLAEMLAVSVPFLRKFLRTTPLSKRDFVMSAFSSVLPFLVIEAQKFKKNGSRFFSKIKKEDRSC